MSSPTPSSSPFRERRALVVDDNSAICGLLKVVIERRDYRVLTFGDPAVALEHLQSNTAPVQFAVVDIGLVGMDGVAFARKLRVLQPETVVIFSTGRNLTPEQAAYAERDRAFFLPKPFHIDQLGKVITEVEKRIGRARSGSRSPV